MAPAESLLIIFIPDSGLDKFKNIPFAKPLNQHGICHSAQRNYNRLLKTRLNQIIAGTATIDHNEILLFNKD